MNRAIEDGSFFENPVLQRRVRAGRATSTCSGSSRTAASTRTSTTCSALLTLRAREDVDPRVHRRPRRLAALGGRTTSPSCPVERIATVAGRYYAMDRDQRWERTQRASTRSSGAGRARGRDPVDCVQQQLRRRRHGRVHRARCIDGRPRLEPRRRRRSSSTSAPTARASSSQRLLEDGFDLTTMTRYRDDLDCPVVFARAARSTNTLAEVLAARRRPPAPLRRDGEVRARHVLLQRRPRGGVAGRDADPRPVAARRRRRYDQKPEMSAAEVAARVLRAEIGDGYRFGVVNFANPDMVGHTGVDPGGRCAPSRPPTAASATSSTRSSGPAACARHRRPRQRRDDARGGRRQPAHGAHDESRPAGRDRVRRRACATAASSPTSHPTVLDLLGHRRSLRR